MSAFIYIVTEGVHDVAFLGRILTVVHHAARVSKRGDLAKPLQAWLDGFTWPTVTKSRSGEHHDILHS